MTETGELEPQSQPIPEPKKFGRREFLKGIAHGTVGVLAGKELGEIVTNIFDSGSGNQPPKTIGELPTTTSPIIATTETEKKEQFTTPESRLKEAGLERFQGFLDTYKYYEKKYGRAIVNWSPGAALPVAQELTNTLLSVADTSQTPNEANIAQWRDGWGTNIGGAAAAAHTHLADVTITGDQMFIGGEKAVLAEMATITPPVVLAYPKNVGQHFNEGGGYAVDNIDTTYFPDNPEESLGVSLHEGMHAVLNTKIMEIKQFLKPTEFAAFMQVYLESVGKTIDTFTDTPFAQLMKDRSLALYITDPDIKTFTDKVAKKKDLVRKYDYLFDTTELKKFELESGATSKSNLELRRNFYAQQIVQTWRKLKQSDPGHSFLHEPDALSQLDELAMHYSHQFVFLREGIFTGQPTPTDILKQNVWEAFLNAASPLPDTSLDGFKEEVRRFALREEDRLILYYGLQIKAEYDGTDGSAQFQLYSFPNDPSLHYVKYKNSNGDRYSFTGAINLPANAIDHRIILTRENRDKNTPQSRTDETATLQYKDGQTLTTVAMPSITLGSNRTNYETVDGPKFYRNYNKPSMVELAPNGKTQQSIPFEINRLNEDGEVTGVEKYNVVTINSTIIVEHNVYDTSRPTQVEPMGLLFDVDKSDAPDLVIVRPINGETPLVAKSVLPGLLDKSPSFNLTQFEFRPDGTITYNRSEKDSWGFRIPVDSRNHELLKQMAKSKTSYNVRPVFVQFANTVTKEIEPRLSIRFDKTGELEPQSQPERVTVITPDEVFLIGDKSFKE